ncbi:MAG: sigma-70 family RNA polymerase sigma factor [Verrucomicrobia bacterium]|nr:sigma-70 family RNA polymerase sigma factor [Verrucomicrobiota bacterium]
MRLPRTFFRALRPIDPVHRWLDRAPATSRRIGPRAAGVISPAPEVNNMQNERIGLDRDASLSEPGLVDVDGAVWRRTCLMDLPEAGLFRQDTYPIFGKLDCSSTVIDVRFRGSAICPCPHDLKREAGHAARGLPPPALGKAALASSVGHAMEPKENLGFSKDQDAEVLHRIALGDLQVFESFYDRNAKFLLGIVLSIVRDEAAAEDVLQEAMLQIWDKARLYDPRYGSALAWAAALTRNKAIDSLRSSLRREKTKREATAEFEVRGPGATPLADREMQLAERALTVRKMLDELPPEQLAAIEMAFFRGLSQTEIAAATGEPLGTIKARIRRGMARLRDFLEGRV